MCVVPFLIILTSILLLPLPCCTCGVLVVLCCVNNVLFYVVVVSFYYYYVLLIKSIYVYWWCLSTTTILIFFLLSLLFSLLILFFFFFLFSSDATRGAHAKRYMKTKPQCVGVELRMDTDDIARVEKLARRVRHNIRHRRKLTTSFENRVVEQTKSVLINNRPSTSTQTR